MKLFIVSLFLFLSACSTISPVGSIAESSLVAMKYQIIRANTQCGKQNIETEIQVLKKIVDRVKSDLVETQFTIDAEVIAKNVNEMKSDGGIAYCNLKLKIMDDEINAIIQAVGVLQK